MERVKSTYNLFKGTFNKGKQNFAVAAMFIGFFFVRNSSHLAIIIGGIIYLGVVLAYIVKYVKLKSYELVALFVACGGIGVHLIVSNYLALQGINSDKFILALPIMLIILFITNYIHVKKNGNKSRIESVKSKSIIIIFILILLELLFIYLVILDRTK